MEGEFAKKKATPVLIFLLLCGLGMIGICCIRSLAGTALTAQMQKLLWGSVILCAAVIPIIFWNRGAYIRVEDNRISGRYHWFGRLDCGLDEVDFVSANMNTLIVTLKSGKRHTVMGVENSWDMFGTIQWKIHRLETETPDTLKQQLAQAKTARKKEMDRVLCGAVLLFAPIFLAAFLTDGKELGEFTSVDWVILGVMGALELALMTVLFWWADRCGKALLPTEQLEYRLRGAVLLAAPLPNNHIAAVYIDASHTERVVVCGFSGDESVYCMEQKITGDYKVETVHTSEIYDSCDDLPNERFAYLIEVTEAFQ